MIYPYYLSLLCILFFLQYTFLTLQTTNPASGPTGPSLGRTRPSPPPPPTSQESGEGIQQMTPNVEHGTGRWESCLWTFGAFHVTNRNVHPDELDAADVRAENY